MLKSFVVGIGIVRGRGVACDVGLVARVFCI